MAQAHVFSGDQAMKLDRNNTKYWDAATQEWRTPKEGYYYDGSMWKPIFRSVPEKGHVFRFNIGGKIYHTSQDTGTYEPSKYWVEFWPSELIAAEGYDVDATIAAGYNCWVGFERNYDGTSNDGYWFNIGAFVDGRYVYSASTVFAGSAYGFSLGYNDIRGRVSQAWIGGQAGAGGEGREFTIKGGYMTVG